MAIDFSPARWDAVKENSARWWAHDLKRPLIQMCLPGRDPGRGRPRVSGRLHQMIYDLSVPAADVVDMVDHAIASTRYMGDGFPVMWPNMGPGALAAFVGGTPEADENTTWFHPDRERSLEEVAFEFDGGNVWFSRLIDFCRAAMERWQGQVQVGMTDLGGTVDVVSTFRPSEKLLYDLYDDPEGVKAATWRVHDVWWKYYDAQAEAMGENPGYTGWLAILERGSVLRPAVRLLLYDRARDVR